LTEQKLARREFSPRVMNDIWDLSNNVYGELIKRQQALEADQDKHLRRSWFLWGRTPGKPGERKGKR